LPVTTIDNTTLSMHWYNLSDIQCTTCVYCVQKLETVTEG